MLDSSKKEVVPAGALFVTFGRKRFQVDSLRDASDKWTDFRDRTGGGVSEVGNGVEVHDEAGKLVGSVSYNGRIWLPDGKELAIPRWMGATLDHP